MAKALRARPPSNVSDVEIQKHIRLVSTAKEELNTANGAYRATLKAAKTAGINQKQLIAALAETKRDFEQFRVDQRDFYRYCALLKMPVEQLDLFSAGAANDTGDEPEAEARLPLGAPTEHDIWEATEAGKTVGMAGGERSTNPHEAGMLHDAWDKGYVTGQGVIAARMGPDQKVASTRKKREPAAAH